MGLIGTRPSRRSMLDDEGYAAAGGCWMGPESSEARRVLPGRATVAPTRVDVVVAPSRTWKGHAIPDAVAVPLAPTPTRIDAWCCAPIGVAVGASWSRGQASDALALPMRR